ncbi:tRNA (5-methylaminomethyl-2-thiouridine)(34)-methyltransferase MnmD [Larkinella humicola]|uniref:tRNA (5-methylaminomethyl-2-thiouridine)(34)-methyltransferase MnmD n=1 Tax=Larkinella humicola TaxID=2607654 RepID=A0A5N1JI04_9BACT|nr:tRNA (5-methylaminomethyl-2-thiouridine)(34)-methyltransferase MnmD [Larkinella humicola]KAA9352931.1 tRNA (5-methylaminomethyl-2-thiouridine)(34)-methyltransferase MnmD [Larkinella humicola]
MRNPEKKTETRIVLTHDGSSSAYNSEFKQHYHSVFGALQESQRVYIELGLYEAFKRFEQISIFEMGLGTGLNALLTLLEAEKSQRAVTYTAVETQPLSLEEASQLNFDALLGSHYLNSVHEAPWNRPVAITPFFQVLKHEGCLEDFRTENRFNLVYFDAFAPEAQPELWTQAVFEQLAAMMHPGGLLTTYCSKSSVKRNLRAAGFLVEKHRGPAHKRDVLRAVKLA